MNYSLRNNDVFIIIDSNSDDLVKHIPGCKGELMLHQSRVVKAVIDTECADHIIAKNDSAVKHIWTNHLRIEMKMGSGKTELAIGIILASQRMNKKPIYANINSIPATIIFNDNRIIEPTIIVVHSSVYFQWVDRIKKFSTLRQFNISDSRSLVKFAKLIHEDLSSFNEEYDVVLVNCKVISGNIDYVLSKCSNLFSASVKQSKRINIILFNMLANFYIRRVIYDDWDMLGLGIIPIENAGSCIRMSATKKVHSSNVFNPYDDSDNFIAETHVPFYMFSNYNVIEQIPCIKVDDDFLSESIELGLLSAPCSMLPAEPEVYIYTICNAENAAINIISELSTDDKILESVNNLSNTSPSIIIKSIFNNRYSAYKMAQKIVAHYGAMDINGLINLPDPPEGLSFQKDDIEQCRPIEYKYRSIIDRVNECVENAKEIILRETSILDRIKNRIKENTCAICMDEINIAPAAIMLCCNNIMHVKCVLMCKNKRCPYCRSNYGNTFDDTFVCLHHDTDIESLLNMSINDSMESVDVENDDKNNITKILIAKQIIIGMPTSVTRERVTLLPLESIVFDKNSTAKCINTNRKVLMYCSADNTIEYFSSKILENVDHSILTNSSKATYKKIIHFRETTKDTAILANSWKDAAGIDFNMASDTIVFNYFHSPYVINQILGRTLRTGQKHRSRIHIIAYENEKSMWFKNYVKCDASSN